MPRRLPLNFQCDDSAAANPLCSNAELIVMMIFTKTYIVTSEGKRDGSMMHRGQAVRDKKKKNVSPRGVEPLPIAS